YLCDQRIEALLKGVAVAVHAAADPQRVLAGLEIEDWHHPNAHMDYIEDESESNHHQDHTRPDSPLSGFVRYLQAGEVAHLQIGGFQKIGRLGVIGDPFDFWEPDIEFFAGTLRGHDQVGCRIFQVV